MDTSFETSHFRFGADGILQSGWVLAQLNFTNTDLTCHDHAPPPEQVLWNMMDSLFLSREAMFPGISQVPWVQKTCKMLQGCLTSAAAGRIIPRQLPDAESIASTLQDSFDNLDTVGPSKPDFSHQAIPKPMREESSPLSLVLTRACQLKLSPSMSLVAPESPTVITAPPNDDEWKH